MNAKGGEAGPERTARDAARTRKAILDAAEALFAERGFDAASLADIGRQAGVSRGAPNYFFGSKVNLYRAVLERLIQAEHQAVEEGDSEGVRKGAHTLKSSSATIGAARLSQMCRRLEDANREQFSMADLSLEELQAEFLAACHALLEVIETSE